jgi:hypothetical protein
MDISLNFQLFVSDLVLCRYRVFNVINFDKTTNGESNDLRLGDNTVEQQKDQQNTNEKCGWH